MTGVGWRRRSGKLEDSRAEVFSALLKLDGDGRNPWSLAPPIFISPLFSIYLPQKYAIILLPLDFVLSSPVYNTFNVIRGVLSLKPHVCLLFCGADRFPGSAPRWFLVLMLDHGFRRNFDFSFLPGV